MLIKVVIIGDTHINEFQYLPKLMLEYLQSANWVIHVGDYVSDKVLNELITLKRSHFLGVYGNADPKSIRETIPAKRIEEIQGYRIGITHPPQGGSSKYTEKRVMKTFENCDLDIIVFGHTHVANIVQFKEILLINPGKGYIEQSSFSPPTSFVVLTINKGITTNIIKIDELF
jgi:putative phosphoesterase